VIEVKKLSILVVGAVGYVLGSRAGRERYEQIKRQAQKAWNRPVVQGAVDDVEQAVRSKASDVGSKVAEAASDAGTKVVHKVTGRTEDIEPVVEASTTGVHPA
jgi:flagellar biosynthesis/type III secretory pathway ATPase